MLIGFILPIQVFARVWVARYDGPGHYYDSPSSIAVDGGGNIYVTGGSCRDSISGDATTIKYNSGSGDTIWVRRYIYHGKDRAQAITVDDLGNIYITGKSYDSTTYNDYLTIKYNSSGDTMWVRRYNGPGNGSDEAAAIAVDDLGYVYVTGSSYNTGTSSDYATIKYNITGDTVWVRRYNGAGNSGDEARGIVVDKKGNVYVSGRDWDSATGYDYATVKYDSSGQQQWVRTYDGLSRTKKRAGFFPAINTDEINAMAIDSNGNVYVTGYSMGNWDIAATTIKYDTWGTEKWVKRYNGSGGSWDEAFAITVDNLGNVYITGGCENSNYDYFIVKYDSMGTKLWDRSYNGPGNADESANAIAVDEDGNVYVAGTDCSTSTGGYDYATIKYNSSGDTMWIRRYDGLAHGADWLSAMAIDENNDIYVTGTSDDSINKTDFVTIKYSSQGVEENSINKTQIIGLLQDISNPLPNLNEIRYELFEPSYVKIDIYNLAGRKIATPVDGYQLGGKQFVRLSNIYNSGIYFIRFSATGKEVSYKETKKLLLIK